MMKILLALGLTVLPPAAGSLDDYRWKKRLLVVTGDAAGVTAKLEKGKAPFIVRFRFEKPEMPDSSSPDLPPRA